MKKIWSSWVYTNTLGFMLSLFVESILVTLLFAFVISMGALFGGVYDVILFVISGALGGFIMGYFQWRILRTKIENARMWIIATTVSWALPWAILGWFWEWSDEIDIFDIYYDYINIFHYYYSTNNFLVAVGVIIVTLIILGFFQWLVKLPQVNGKGLWMVSTIIGYALIGFIFAAPTFLGVFVIPGLVGGLLLASLTRQGFVYLYR